jgi:hypothetical protein
MTVPSSVSIATRSGVNELCRSAAPNRRCDARSSCRRDYDIVEDSVLALECPEGSALGEARRDGVELVPAFQAAVGLDNGFDEQITND